MMDRLNAISDISYLCMREALTLMFRIPLEEMMKFLYSLISLWILFHKSRVMIGGFDCGSLLHDACRLWLQLFPPMRRETLTIKNRPVVIRRPRDIVSFYCCSVLAWTFLCLATYGTVIMIRILYDSGSGPCLMFLLVNGCWNHMLFSIILDFFHGG